MSEGQGELILYRTEDGRTAAEPIVARRCRASGPDVLQRLGLHYDAANALTRVNDA
ncbi:hypothetical protein [Lysobacter hankyongensis]|uniref:Uncharacterized protein n=1 Tax=Lysobacter hankyongensis TaxID=1176535 RepID=A0ABP9C676_9GAMM